MKKYIIFLLMLSTMLAAQEVNINASLDRPFKEADVGTAVSIRVVGNYFKGISIASIFNKLATLQQIASSTEEYSTTHYTANGWDFDGNFTVFTAFWSADQNLNALKSELSGFYNNFPQSSEVFTNSLCNSSDPYNTVAYYDWFGREIERSTAYDGDLDANLNANGTTTQTLRFYAGRSTAAGTGTNDYSATDEIEITTSNGVRYNIYAYDTTTPIVLDLDGDQKLEASGGEWLPHAANKNATKWVEFDINGDGFDEAIEWVGPNDGLLLSYVPGIGEKASGNCLFGDAKGYVNGYEQLSTLDKNGDKKLTDAELDTLSVWQDKNGNAAIDIGEVTSVKNLGITEINTSNTNMMSFFVRDGKNYLMWDWYPTMLMVKKTKNK